MPNQAKAAIACLLAFVCLLLAGGGLTDVPFAPTNPPPISEPGLTIMVVEESVDTNTALDNDWFAESFRKYRAEQGGNYRHVDDDSSMENDTDWAKTLHARLKAMPLPAWYVGNEESFEEGAYPVGEAEQIARKYGE